VGAPYQTPAPSKAAYRDFITSVQGCARKTSAATARTLAVAASSTTRDSTAASKRARAEGSTRQSLARRSCFLRLAPASECPTQIEHASPENGRGQRARNSRSAASVLPSAARAVPDYCGHRTFALPSTVGNSSVPLLISRRRESHEPGGLRDRRRRPDSNRLFVSTRASAARAFRARRFARFTCTAASSGADAVPRAAPFGSPGSPVLASRFPRLFQAAALSGSRLTASRKSLTGFCGSAQRTIGGSEPVQQSGSSGASFIARSSRFAPASPFPAHSRTASCGFPDSRIA